MKAIGLIGGMSWISSREYYSILNTEYNKRKGKNHSCPILMHSFDFGEIEKLQMENEWIRLCEIMSEAAIKVEKGGADLILICSNTMHFCAESMQARVMIPVLHIAEAVGKEIRAFNLTRVGLLGTGYLMKMPVYTDLLKNKFSIDTILPTDKEIDQINQIIYEELIRGIVNESSTQRILDISDRLISHGAQGIILGCTELPMVVQHATSKIRFFDSTVLHALYGLDYAMKEHLYA